jgi:hypothetical protein
MIIDVIQSVIEVLHPVVEVSECSGVGDRLLLTA